MAEELGTASILLLAFFAAVGMFMLWLFYQFRLTAKQKMHEVAGKMDELEHQYVRIKPELDELRQELATKVDYDYLEGKMHQLVRIVASRQPARQRPPAQTIVIPAARRKKHSY